MFKSGVLVYAPEYQAQVDKELEMIKASVETMSSFSSREAYVSHCNTQVQTWLRPTRHLPASPEDASDEDPNTQRASMGLPPVFPAIGNGPRPNRLGTFIYPSPAKRTRVKTPSIEPLPGAETNQGINVAADVGMTADEEAAQLRSFPSLGHYKSHIARRYRQERRPIAVRAQSLCVVTYL